MNTPAQALNDTLVQHAPAVRSLLSSRGAKAFFPHGGILGQTAQAKGKRFNATIGIALEEDGSPMRLPCMTNEIDLPPKSVFPYASSFGVPKLRAMWQSMIQRKNPSLHAEITLPVVTCALTHGLSVAGYLFLDKGDDLILPDMFWGNYKLTFAQQFGVHLQTFNTFRSGGFDTEALQEALNTGAPGKRVVLLNFPNNPTGYTPTVQEVEEITDVLLGSAKAGNHIAVLIDDAYFGLVYEDGIFTESLFAKLANLHENILAVKIDGATKEDYAWGLRVGFVTYGVKGMTQEVSNVLEDKTAGAVRATISNVSHPGQSLLLDAYSSPSYWQEKEEKAAILNTRYEEVRRCLSEQDDSAFFTPLPYNSGYFMCIELAEDLPAETVRKVLLDEFDTGVIATGNLLRIAYSSIATSDIEQLFINIRLACALVRANNSSPVSHEPVHA